MQAGLLQWIESYKPDLIRCGLQASDKNVESKEIKRGIANSLENEIGLSRRVIAYFSNPYQKNLADRLTAEIEKVNDLEISFDARQKNITIAYLPTILAINSALDDCLAAVPCRQPVKAIENLAAELYRFSIELIKAKNVVSNKFYDIEIKTFQCEINSIQHCKDIPLPPIIIHKQNETISDMVNRYYKWCIDALTIYRDKWLASEQAKYDAMTIRQRLDALAAEITGLATAIIRISPGAIQEYWKDWYAKADKIIVEAKKQGITLRPINRTSDMEANRDNLLNWCRQEVDKATQIEPNDSIEKIANEVANLLHKKQNQKQFEQYKDDFHKQWAKYQDEIKKANLENFKKNEPIPKELSDYLSSLDPRKKLRIGINAISPKTRQDQLWRAYIWLIIIHDSLLKSNVPIDDSKVEPLKELYEIIQGIITDIGEKHPVKRRIGDNVSGLFHFQIALEAVKENINADTAKQTISGKTQDNLTDTKHNSGKEKELSKEVQVLAILADNPKLLDTEIAKKAGINRTSLYRMKKFKQVKEVLQSSKADLPKGEKSKDGDIEAWDN